MRCEIAKKTIKFVFSLYCVYLCRAKRGQNAGNFLSCCNNSRLCEVIFAQRDDMKSVFKGSMVRFVVLFAAVVLSQSIGDMSLIKTSRLASGVTLLTEASESGRTKALSSNQGKDRKDIEVALSETRHTTNISQDDLDYVPVCDFEFHMSSSLNTCLHNLNANLLLRKDLSQLRVLII